MNRLLPAFTRQISVAAVLLAITAGGFIAVGIRINTSASVPRGFYLITHGMIAKGRYVLLCPPGSPVFAEARRRGYISAGFCKGGYGYLMKAVAATPGDNIAVLPTGVTVNGALLPYSKPLPYDGAGRPLPVLRFTNYTLAKNEALLMTQQSPLSFDSRYFGVVPQSAVQAVIKPLLTW